MKHLVIGILFFSSSVFAQEAVEVSDSTPTSTTTKIEGVKPASARRGWTETGFGIHSIDAGARFLNVAVGMDFTRRVAIGLRGALPLSATKEDQNQQVFLAGIFCRLYMANLANKFYFEPSITKGYIDTTLNDFSLVGLTYGYERSLSKEFGIGLAAGVDYHPSVEEGLYSKFALNGSYTF